MLIEIGEVKILCETGIGAHFEPSLAERYGVVESEHRLLDNLRRLGIAPEAIDYVILSHLHFDHAGGLLPSFHEMSQGQNELVFPKAKFVVGEEAWQRALHPHPRDRASFIPGLSEKLEKSGRLLLVKGDSIADFSPELISFRFTNGHTPGQMHTLIRGSQDCMFFAGDLIPGKAWVHVPITMGYDRFPEQVIDEKHALYDELVPAQWILFYTHDPLVAASRVQIDSKGRYICFDEKTELKRYLL
jgi:glyoxylase-like metal-dependent hydrolase (beta-lactamase superfamily II)